MDRKRENNVATEAINVTARGNHNIHALGSVINGPVIGTLINFYGPPPRLQAKSCLPTIPESGSGVETFPAFGGSRVFAAAHRVEESWWSDIPGDGVADVDITATEPITAVHSPYLDGAQRVYTQLITDPSTIVELKPLATDRGWGVANRIHAADAAARTRLSAVCYPGGEEVHLFYITSKGTIQELEWTPQSGWRPGSLFNGKAPKVSSWSSLSALRSANYMKLYYQRDDMVCELSYAFGDKTWTFKELERGDRGTPLASTSYAARDATVYHVYFQDQGELREYRSEKHDTSIEFLPVPDSFPRQCSTLSAISWYSDRAFIRVHYVSDSGEVCELSWDDREKWKWQSLSLSDGSLLDGTQITALQMDYGRGIRVYYASPGSTASPGGALMQIAFSHRVAKPKVKSVYTGFLVKDGP